MDASVLFSVRTCKLCFQFHYFLLKAVNFLFQILDLLVSLFVFQPGSHEIVLQIIDFLVFPFIFLHQMIGLLLRLEIIIRDIQLDQHIPVIQGLALEAVQLIEFIDLSVYVRGNFLKVLRALISAQLNDLPAD